MHTFVERIYDFYVLSWKCYFHISTSITGFYTCTYLYKYNVSAANGTTMYSPTFDDSYRITMSLSVFLNHTTDHLKIIIDYAQYQRTLANINGANLQAGHWNTVNLSTNVHQGDRVRCASRKTLWKVT